MVFEIYKCFYKNIGTFSQMKERFVAWFCGGDNSSFSGISPKIRIQRRLRQTAGRKKYILIELNGRENFFLLGGPVSDSSKENRILLQVFTLIRKQSPKEKNYIDKEKVACRKYLDKEEN
ncbi:MAG: hypothetical protein ACYDEF_13270 [Methanosarcina sp.]|nr:hypothetical protein BGV40_11495 [Methanosarcina sp. Ant1]